MLVRVGRVVFLGHVVTEEEIRQGFEAVGVMPRDVDRDQVVVADVLREGLAGLAIEHHNAGGPLQAREEVVLAALVIVQTANHALAREREVRLHGALGQAAVPAELAEPAPLVLEAAKRDDLDARDHCLLAPFVRTKSLTA